MGYLCLDRFGFPSFCMSSILKVLLQCLRLLGPVRPVREYIQKFLRRWTLLLAVLGRKLSLLWRCHDGFGKPGTSRRPKSSGSPVSHSPTSREYVVAASTVPESANYPSSQELAERQAATAALTTGIPPTTQENLSVDHSYANDAIDPDDPPPSFDGRILAHHSSGNLSAVSVQSRASSRFSVITTSRESIRAIPVGQPSRPSRATHRQFGRGPNPSKSRDRSSPTSRSHTPRQLPRLEIVTLDAPHFAHGDDGVGSVNQPSPSSDTQESPSPPSMDRNSKKRSSTSLVFNVQNPSTESLPSSSVMNPQPLTDQPFGIDSAATAHSSRVKIPADLYDEGLIRSPTSLSDNLLPEGRFVQLINSDQVPRYTKNFVMSAVGC